MKIVLVINSMISNQEKITNVIPNQGEFYFLYDGRHKWSIDKIVEQHKENYLINFFPNDPTAGVGSLEEIYETRMWGNPLFHVASYSTKELNTVEAYESFKDLYDILFNKVYGIDDVFDEIISNF